jgi:hypothetical protein
MCDQQMVETASAVTALSATPTNKQMMEFIISEFP